MGRVEGLLPLICLALVCNRVLGHLCEGVLNWLERLLLSSLHVKSQYQWRKNKLGDVDPSLPDLSLSLRFLPMMEGDTRMIRHYLGGAPSPIVMKYMECEPVPPCESVEVRSIDHHCKPAIILLYQATKLMGATTSSISSLIWTESSAYNYRSHPSPLSTSMDLYAIQKCC